MIFLSCEHAFGILLPLLTMCLLHPSLAIDPDRHQSALSQDKPSPATQDPISREISSSPLLSFHRSLCQIESITNGEAAVGNYLFSYLKRHNFRVLRQEVPQPPGSENTGKRFNIFAWPEDAISPSTFHHYQDEDDALDNFAPKVIVTSHIDTVPPFIPYSASAPSLSNPVVQGGELNRSEILISGRGTVDAKACVAAQVHAVLSLRASSHHDQQRSGSDDFPSSPSAASSSLPVALLFVVGEEYNGDGMKHFSSSPLHSHLSHLTNPYTSLIFGEPTESRLASGHKGLLVFKLRARGKAAHSGYPWLGRSANSMIIPVLAAVDRLGDLPEEEGGLPRNDRYGNSTVNIGLIRGGVAANVVPEEAEADVAVRLAGGTTAISKQIIHTAVKAANEDVELEFGGVEYPPVDLDTDVAGFANVTVNYGTDVPNLEVGRLGVRLYLYGPGSILVAHGDHEALTVRDLEAAVEGYKRLILAALAR